MAESFIKKQSKTGKITDPRSIITAAGIFLLLMEGWKQLYLFFKVYKGQYYNVWYFPFQLCSMPMYFCLLYALFSRKYKAFGKASLSSTINKAPLSPGTNKADEASEEISSVLLAFVRDFGMLGGIMALIVHQGFTDTGYVLLSIHGYVWHITLIFISVYITVHRLADFGKTCFKREVFLFLSCAAIALLINCLLHSYGDCDMFYITPYHLSSQLVFVDIDRLVGRPLGIVYYLSAAALGAGLIHFLLMRLMSKRDKEDESWR